MINKVHAFLFVLGVFSILILSIGVQTYRLGNAQEDRDEWKASAQKFETALQEEQISKKAQIDALQENSNREANRTSTLINQIKKVQNSDEKIDCDIPDMLIDAMRL